MTGGGKDLKNQVKSYGCLSEFFKNLKYFYKKLSNFLTSRREEELCRGSILIEFAVCMPILIILLFYIHDLIRIKRYYAQTEFVGQQMANMIQNISQKRDNKRLNKNDFKNITSLAWLTMFPGNTRYNTKASLGYSPGIALYYVKGLDNGNASCIWRVWSSYENSSTPSSDLHWDPGTGGYAHLSVKYRTNLTPSSIHPMLKISPGDTKIILEVTFIANPNWKNSLGESSNKQKFKLHLLNPRVVAGDKNAFHTLFTSVVIFTPKPGLFDEDGPPT